MREPPAPLRLDFKREEEREYESRRRREAAAVAGERGGFVRAGRAGERAAAPGSARGGGVVDEAPGTLQSPETTRARRRGPSCRPLGVCRGAGILCPQPLCELHRPPLRSPPLATGGSRRRTRGFPRGCGSHWQPFALPTREL